MNPEQQFESELETFRKECEAASQFFYGFRAVHEIARSQTHVFRFLNEYPLFWNTVVGALQTSALIALGRIFDQKSPHNLDKVLHIASNNLYIFSKQALGRRKQGNQRETPGWLAAYLQDAHMPTAMDFRRLKRHVKKYRRIYEGNYRDLRHKVYAHKVVSDPAEVQILMAKTKIREMEQLFVFLLKLCESLWELFLNGRKPVLRPLRYSAKRLRSLAAAPGRGRAVHEEITRVVITVNLPLVDGGLVLHREAIHRRVSPVAAPAYKGVSPCAQNSPIPAQLCR
jgi:hypothetical protein